MHSVQIRDVKHETGYETRNRLLKQLTTNEMDAKNKLATQNQTL